MSITLRDGSRSTNPLLDRIVEFDEASRDFPVRTALRTLEPRGRTWYIRTWLDQGQEGACVSFSWHHLVSASPAITHGITDQICRDAYFQIQRDDEWPGGEYPGASPRYSGTSVLAGAKFMQAAGYFAEYRWAFSVEEVMAAISHEGPVEFGIPWLDSMFEPRPSGLLDCSGNVAGGHAIMGRGLSLKPRLKGEKLSEPVVRVHNSWGHSWGHDGDAYVKISDLESLLKQDGECCVPTQRKRVRVPV